MATVDWQIIPRQADLTRLYDPLSRWSTLELVERASFVPSGWTVTGPPATLGIFAPGMGSILDRNGEQIVSGKVSGIKRGRSKVNGRSVESMEVTFVDDSMPVGSRIIFPSPSHNLTDAVSKFPSAYDLRTGDIESLIIGYIRSHAGDLAQADRRVPRLRVPASLGRGGTTQVSGRLDHLGVLIGSLAEAGNLRVIVKHTEDGTGAWLDLVIDAVSDLSDDVRFGTADTTAAGIIDEWEYEITAPRTTRAVVAGGGELADRDFLQLDDLAAEALWGMSVETLIDQRQVDPTSAEKLKELTRAATEELEEGVGAVSVKFTPVLGPDLQYRRDVRLGDIVGYDLPGLEPGKDRIREATTIVAARNGQATETVSVVVGHPDAPLTRTQQQAARALREINVIKRSK